MSVVTDFKTLRANAWAFVPAALLTSLIGLQLWLVRSAVHDPSFAVEDDYYAKSVSWNARMSQERENARLGFTTDVKVTTDTGGNSRVVVKLLSRDGAPVIGATMSAEAFFVARANKPIAARFSEGSPGTYEASLRTAHPGLWEFRLSAERGGDHFTQVVRRDVAPAAGAML